MLKRTSWFSSMSQKRLVTTRSGLSREGSFYDHTQAGISALYQERTLLSSHNIVYWRLGQKNIR